MTPRSLSEIVEEAKDGVRPSHDECLYAMLALDYLNTFTRQDLDRAMKGPGKSGQWLFRPDEECFRREKSAYAQPPEKWLGSFHPQNVEHQRKRAIFKKIADKIIQGEA